jgi:hypothetical protein
MSGADDSKKKRTEVASFTVDVRILLRPHRVSKREREKVLFSLTLGFFLLLLSSCTRARKSGSLKRHAQT